MDIATKKRMVIDALKNGDSLSKIGRDIFNSKGTASLNAFINKYGIQIDKYNDSYRFVNQEWLKAALEECGTPNKVASRYNMARTSVTRYAKKYGLYEKKFSRTKTNKIDETYFEEIDNAKKAYWLGFIMADGSLYHYKDSDKVQFELKIKESDKELMENFAEDIGFPVEKLVFRDSTRKGTLTHSIALKTYNKRFCDNLIKHGIVDRKSGKESFPKIPTEFQRDFVRGFWDGDGNISEICTAVSMSFKIISQLSLFFAKRFVVTFVNYSITNNKKMIYSIKIPKKSLSAFKNIVYYDGCFGLKRKIECINKIIKSIRNDE